MNRPTSTIADNVTEAASAVRSRLVGRPASAVAVACTAVVAAITTARRVAATNSYLVIEHSLPTYDGHAGPLFVALAGGLVALAALSACLDAGLAPTVALAGAPVFGWATNHASAPISPHYAATFPLEMAVLYGGLFGLVGYLLGAGARQSAPPALRGRSALAVLLALVAVAAVLLGSRFELVALRPAYDGPLRAVEAGAGARVGHEERFLVQLAGLGCVAALLSARWRRAGLVTQLCGGAVLLSAGLDALYQYEAFDLYAGVRLLDGASGAVVLGAAPYLFALGGILLVTAGAVGYRSPGEATTAPVVREPTERSGPSA